MTLVVIDAGWTGTPEVLRVTKREIEALAPAEFAAFRGGKLLPDVSAVWDDLDIVFTRQPPIPVITTLRTTTPSP